MTISRRTFSKLTLAAFGAGALGSTAGAGSLPAPFDKPGSVRMALVRYLSTGDFFDSYLAGAKEQAEALGVDLQVFDSRQDASAKPKWSTRRSRLVSTASSYSMAQPTP